MTVINYIKRQALWSLEIIVLIAVFLFSVLLELDLAVSLFWQFYLAMAVLSFILILPGFLSPLRQRVLWLFLIFNAALLCLHFLVLNPVKPFTQFQQAITQGMTSGDVQHLLVQYFPENGQFRRPEWSGDQTFRSYRLDPTDGAYDAEIIVVYFENDRVVSTKYLPD
jgi:hypothetical protein